MAAKSNLRRKRNTGRGPAFKLTAYYAVFFGLLCIALFWLANVALTQTIQRKQLKAVRNKALEYRAWYLKGDTSQLEARMKEQSLQAGDTLLVQVEGNDNYAYVTVENQDDLPHEDLQKLEGLVEGSNIRLGEQRWTIVSIPLDDDGLILRAGKNSQALEEILTEFRKTSIFLLIPGGLFAIGAGAFFTYRFLLPTRRLIATMRGILESGDLSQRAKIDPKGNELNAMVELFNQLLGENEKLISVMQESLDHIAHDLRSPFSRIRMISERALTNSNANSFDEYKNALEHCAEEIDYVEQLLTVLMNVAEAKSGALVLKKETVAAADLLNGVAELYELMAEERQIALRFDCDESLVLEGDRTRLLQSLANLLDNAIKYSKDQTTITLKGELEGDTVLLSVSDQGIGIGEDDLPHIWNRLFRADRSRTERGMGLGLSLVKAIVAAHGGEVSVESTPGKGSCFRMTLPVPQAA